MVGGGGRGVKGGGGGWDGGALRGGKKIKKLQTFACLSRRFYSPIPHNKGVQVIQDACPRVSSEAVRLPLFFFVSIISQKNTRRVRTYACHSVERTTRWARTGADSWARNNRSCGPFSPRYLDDRQSQLLSTNTTKSNPVNTERKLHSTEGCCCTEGWIRCHTFTRYHTPFEK